MVAEEFVVRHGERGDVVHREAAEAGSAAAHHLHRREHQFVVRVVAEDIGLDDADVVLVDQRDAVALSRRVTSCFTCVYSPRKPKLPR